MFYRRKVLTFLPNKIAIDEYESKSKFKDQTVISINIIEFLTLKKYCETKLFNLKERHKNIVDINL